MHKITCPCGFKLEGFRSIPLHGRRCKAVTQEFRFWVKVDKSPRPDGCWIWKGARSLSGYGTFPWQTGSNINAHRAAWMLTHGPIEGKGIDVLHTCNNGHIGCVRPDHLYLGTDKENVRDRILAGTQPRGVYEYLHPDTVRAIRALQGQKSAVETGKQFGRCYRAIQKIWARHVYKNVT